MLLRTRVWRGMVVTVLAVAAVAGSASVPYWWTQGVIDTNATPNDFGAANQGQAKWMARQARDAFETNLYAFGGAGTGINARVDAFSATNNFLPLNLGQLKYLAEPFYDRLTAVGWTNAFPAGMWGTRPWTASVSDDADFAAVNLGQLKFVFSFDTEAVLDSDSDSLVDRIERWMGLALDDSDTDNDGTLDGDEDADNDGLSNAYEANTARTDPTNSDTNAPSVTILTPTNGLVKVWIP